MQFSIASTEIILTSLLKKRFKRFKRFRGRDISPERFARFGALASRDEVTDGRKHLLDRISQTEG